MVQKQDGYHLVRFSNGHDHRKSKLLASIDCFNKQLTWLRNFFHDLVLQGQFLSKFDQIS